MSLSCSAKDWTEGDLEGVPSPCQSSIKEACLTCCRYLPTFWSHTWGAPSWKTLSTKAIRRTPLQERSPPNLRYWEHVFSVCPHQCSWQAWHACEPSEGLLLCFAEASAARRSRRLLHPEPLPAATRLCCSLLGNAGRARAARVLREELHLPAHKPSEPPAQAQTPEYSLLLNISARSTPISKFDGTGAAWLQISSPSHLSSPLHPSPLPHAGAA